MNIYGRKAKELRPGANDVSGVAPGVYFVMRRASRGQGFEGSAKIVITK